MYRKILAPIDGSDRAKLAAAHAADLAKKLDAELTLLHVVPHLPAYVNRYSDHLGSVEQTLLEEFSKEGEKTLTEIKWALTKKDIKAHTILVIGNPAEEICKIAEEESFDLIVMGSRGLGEIKAYIMGSVSSRVVRHAKCPVLIYR